MSEKGRCATNIAIGIFVITLTILICMPLMREKRPSAESPSYNYEYSHTSNAQPIAAEAKHTDPAPIDVEQYRAAYRDEQNAGPAESVAKAFFAILENYSERKGSMDAAAKRPFNPSHEDD